MRKYKRRLVSILHQPDVYRAHVLWEVLPCSRSRLAWQIPACRRCGSVGRDVCPGINGEVAFLFWAICSTGATAPGGSSTGAAGTRDERTVDGGRGADLDLLHPFRPFWLLKLGSGCQTWLGWGAGGGGGGVADGTAASSRAADFGN